MPAERVVLVHDWLTGLRGGEKCLEPLARRWPDARLLTLLHKRGSVPPAIEQLRISPSRLNRLPRVDRYYRYLLPLMPFAAGWKVTDADLVVSLSHCVAKSARPPAGVPHVCYCFTPMRYAWHMQGSYFRAAGLAGKLKAAAVDALMGRIRRWDRRTADRVTHFVAISRTVQTRIRECYGRDSVVIYPPVDTDYYTPAPVPREDFYLVVSALAPYKRFDLAIEACATLGKKLVVIGSGQDAKKLQAKAAPGITFLGWQADDVIRDHLRRAKALLFPGEEDFGIVPLEAQACGCPVIAFGRGGATETVRAGGPDPTGVLFDEQTADALAAAIETFEGNADRFDPRAARRNALLFRKDRFEAELFGYLDALTDGAPARRAA
ncbi:glycosyltransferase [Urbifossiella limnaea]|uniref:GDP-mannose-dependent alpha-(1-6)-phosphatidylinositol monomannoside mannosyltransferase n=1 Tax=Urbifossiella limnaea TaxID=2528023 RepID=A0A517Y1N3_9BACT|nr:glycosyltransferase [Urbifossiella limnaea]QDU23642.1 GDP-mannose-dependent alpha-(1-6)-phosphatidylinositol monomannoside mannosyltransferase [Urbifossiella limnaea]